MANSRCSDSAIFLEQSNLLFSKYFKQIFSSPEDQIGDAFYFEAFSDRKHKI